MKKLFTLMFLLLGAVQGIYAQEPYAALSADNTTLTFYYDNNKESRSGMSVGPFTNEYNYTTYEYEVNTEWYSQRDNITTVVFDKSFVNYADLSSTAYWFYECSNLTTVNGLENLNTSNVTDMNSMFSGCSGLTSLNVSNFNTSNVTDMNSMFSGCSGLTSLNVSNFNTANVTNMNYMFSGCSSLTNLDVSNFDTTNVIYLIGLFNCCSCLTSLDLSNFNTEKVSNMQALFFGCSGLTSLDMSIFNTANVTNMSYMFHGCSGLTSLDVSNFNTANVTNMSYMFYGCSGLTSLDVNNFNTANVKDMSCMFCDCSSLSTLDVSNFNTAKVTRMIQMFDSCYKMTIIYCNDAWNCTYSGYMFYDCTSLKGAISYDSQKTDVTYANPIDGYFTSTGQEILSPYAVLSDDNTKLTFYYDTKMKSNNGMSVLATAEVNWNTGTFVVKMEWYNQRNTITTVVFDKSFADYNDLTSTEYWFSGCNNLATIIGIENLNTENVTNMIQMFSDCSSLTKLDVSNFNTENVKNMGSMFSGCSSLTSLDVSNFNTANVESMSSMFFRCSSLTSLDLSNFNTSNVEGMSSMFSGCSSLTSLDLSSLNTANVTFMSNMFSLCSGLTSLDVSKFNTAKVKDMSGMFYNCSSLTSLDISNFNTVNVTDLQGMFSDCSSLTSLDVSNFDTEKVTNMRSMFLNCSALTTIYCEEAWRCKSSSSMFEGCTSLKGVISYDSENTDIAGANPIDGYFTSTGKVILRPYAVLSDDNTKLTFYYDANKKSNGGLSVGPNSYPSAVGWCEQCENIRTVTFDDSFANYTDLSSTAYWFDDCSNLTTINKIENLNTVNVTDMKNMFYGCSGLTSLDVSNFNTPNVKNMSYMFEDCSGLTSLDVSNFNTANVTNMENMFTNCSSLTSLDVSNFNTTNVTNMSYMFYGCSGLTSLDVSNFNTANVTTMWSMFNGCTGLTSLDVSNFNTDNVTSMLWMFKGCSGLTSLDLSNFNTDNVTRMDAMFACCSSLTNIYCNDSWSCNLSENMFNGCTSLVGAISYDEAKTDVTYANPTTGYFTYKGLHPMDDEEVSFGEDGNLNVNTDLGGTVINNVYFNINPENGCYDAEEKCVVVSKPMTDEEIESVFGKDLLSDEVKSTFAGMVIEVPTGKGMVTVEAQTTGGMTLKVKIGSADPIEMELEGKLKMKFPYNVTEPTYVYIYAGEVSAAGSRNFGSRGNESPSLKIYGISVSTDTYLKGDANGDGVISDADVIAVKDYIMGNEPENFVFEGADANEDGKVNVADIVEIVNKKK